MGPEFSCIIKEAKLLGSGLGIPCLDRVEEAEAQCALLKELRITVYRVQRHALVSGLRNQNLALDSSSVITTSTAETAEQEQEQERENSTNHNWFLVDPPVKEDGDAWADNAAVGPSSCSETEVIDLISPCPQVRSRRLARRNQEHNGRQPHATIIELSDSETDETSPADEDYFIKARELRMFLESIRKDIC